MQMIKDQPVFFAVAALGSVVVHAALFWWKYRLRKSNNYLVFGKALLIEEVENMQGEACDIDEATEESGSATKPSTLHPFYPLLTKPTQKRPGILPYKQEIKDTSPTSITVPLFTSPPAEGWDRSERKRYEDDDDNDDQLACSHGSNASIVSFVPSSVLNIDDAYAQRADATWAPKPPKSPFEIPFRRTSANIAKTTTGIQRKMSIRDNASTVSCKSA